MRKLFNSFGIKSAAALAVAATGSLANLTVVQAEDPVEQKIFVVTSDDDDEDGAGDGEEKQLTVRVVKEPKLWLGIMLKDIEGDLARYLESDEGILVDSVVEESPAAKAGIKEGDILLSVGETKLTKPQELLKVMGGLEAEGASLEIRLLRKGEEKTVEVVPAARPESEEILVRELEDLHLDLKEGEEAGEALKKALGRLRVGELGEDVNILRFGNPSMVFRTRDHNAAVEGDLEAVIVRDVDGDKIEVKVVRKNDKPATITVTHGDEVTEYTEENLNEMPKEISVIVEPMIDGKSEPARRWQFPNRWSEMDRCRVR